MSDIFTQISEIEKEIRETPYHKGTEHHIGMLRARIARLKDKQIEGSSKGGGGGGRGYSVKKQGDATIVLVGPPSVGKSTLINKLTNAKSKIAPYAFTTVSVIPGMMNYRGANLQILDVPGLIQGAEEGKGRGREVLSVIRNCDLVIMMTDIKNVKSFQTISEALYRNGVRLNSSHPHIIVNKKIDGGITIKSNIKQDLDIETIKSVILEMGVKSAEIMINEKTTLDRLIDTLSSNRVYIPCLYVINKCDQIKKPLKLDYDLIYISADKDIGLSQFRDKIWKALNFITVYLVKPNSQPNQDNPIVVQSGKTLGQIAKEIGNNFADTIKGAVIWGNGAKFDAQEVSLNTKAVDGMMVRFI